MTEKHIFVYKLLFTDFSLFLGKNGNPPEKSNPTLSQ